jgi:type VI secretion system protein ImpC
LRHRGPWLREGIEAIVEKEQPFMSEVNIDVSLGAQRKPVELRSPDQPFRIAVLGDFSGRANRAVKPAGPRLAGRRPMLIDPDNFEVVMESLQVGLQLPAGALRFAELDDFHPDQIYRNIPLFQTLRQTRKQLSDPETFRAAAPPPAPAQPAPTSGSLLDQIAGVSAAPEPAPTRKPSADAVLDDAIRRIVAPHLTPKPDPRQHELVAQVDAAAGELMREILGDPDFQALEAAWRSMFLLLQRIETGVDLKIYLIDVTREDLIEDVLGASDPHSTGLYRLLVDEAAGTPGETPWAVVAGNYTFTPGERECQALARIATIAREAGAPFLAAMHPRLMGCESIAATPDTDDWKTPVETGNMQAWQRLRAIPDACWLGLAMPRFLLRLPYGKATSSSDVFDFEEMPQPPAHESYLWGNPAIACACLLGEAFNRQGWDLRPGLVNRLDGVPIHSYKRGGESVITPPAEVWITERFAGRILDQGVIALASVKNGDAVQLVRLQSIAQPPRLLAGPWA